MNYGRQRMTGKIDSLARTSLTFKDAVLADSSPAGLWLLNETNLSGANVWQDTSGNFRHAIDQTDTNNPTPTQTNLAGDLSSCAVFDGINDRIAVAHNPAFNATMVSVEAWVKATASLYILSRYDNYASFSVNSFNTWINGTGTGITRYSGGNSTTYTSNTIINNGQWHHVVWTYQSGTGGYILYIDGILVDQQTTSGTINSSSYPLVIGTGYQGGTHTVFYPGSLSGVAYYPGIILNQIQVSSHYNASRP